MLDPETLRPMEAKAVAALPDGPGWRFEPKWDGFRCLAFRDGERIDLRSKSGKPLARYFPEVAALLASLPASRFVLDGELIIPTEEGLSFQALQMRLHPAESRVRRLAAETPARLMLFDRLDDGLDQPLSARRASLEKFCRTGGAAGLMLSPFTEDRGRALGWLARTGGALDGVIAKRADEPYRPGERAMLKVKRLRTADCVVGGFRYASGDDRAVGSLLLGLYDEAGLLHHVGFTSAIPPEERAGLTGRLEALVQAPGFSGNAPGGASRWANERSTEWQPLAPALVVEVRYDQVTGRRFRHGTRFLRWRPDKAPGQCTMEQLAQEFDPVGLELG